VSSGRAIKITHSLRGKMSVVPIPMRTGRPREALLTGVAGCVTAVRADGGRENAQQRRLLARGRVPGPSSVLEKKKKKTAENADSNGIN